jgi:response regulator RpfG family c-di-GMP phosphodiesterase
MMGGSDRVLIVDDEANLLSGLRRMLGQKFNVSVAAGGAEALELVGREGPFAVVISDMRMPGMDGLELLRRLQDLAPDTVRMMLTGNAEQKTAVDAINAGSIFRFFNKPCSMQVLSEGIEAALRQYRLITAEKALLEGTVAGAIGLLTDVLSLVAPDTFERSLRLRGWSRQVAAQMGLGSAWDLELAAALAHLGMISVPPEVVARHRAGQKLTEVEDEMLERAPRTGAELIRKIPRLESVADAVACQGKWFNGQGHPADGRAGADIPLAGRILHVLMALDEAGAGQVTRDALASFDRSPGRFDPVVVAATRAALAGATIEAATTFAHLDVAARALLPGDLLEADLQLEGGRLVLAAGQTITDALFLRLQNLQRMYRFVEPIRVRRVVSGR